MATEQKAGGDFSGKTSDSQPIIPFQVEADMRKGPPSSAVIKLHGAIETNQNRLLERILNPLHKACVKHLIVDLSDVPVIERVPVQTLVRFAQERKEAGMQHPCSLTGLRPAVVDAIKKIQPGKVFVVYKHWAHS
jgi:anti-anti-sigma regulatory factor